MKNIQLNTLKLVVGVVMIASIGACSKDNKADPNANTIVITGTGDINSKLDEFRSLLGPQVNTTPGHLAGRREINWDGVPDELLNQKLPLDFFNPTGPQANIANQRGLTYSAAGSFQVSATNFSEVNPIASGEFSSFSGAKSFANISSSLWEVGFQVPSKTDLAFVKGFGIVFSDVDQPQSASMEFFNGNRSLGKFFVPAKTGSNFSFLGVYFKNEQVTRIRVSHDGELDKGLNDVTGNGPSDLVTMDNFLYNEPVRK